MTKFSGFVFILFSVIPTISFGQVELINAYQKNDSYKALEVAYELESLKPLSSGYGELIAWMDRALYERVKPTIIHSEQSRFQPLLEWPMFSGESGFKMYVGLIYYLSEHSQSQQLKQEFLKVLATTDVAIGPALSESVIYPQSYVVESAIYRQGRSWWQRFKEDVLRRQPKDIGQNLARSTAKVKEIQDRMNTALVPYGTFFLTEKRGAYTVRYTPSRISMAVCSRLLSVAAKLGSEKLD